MSKNNKQIDRTESAFPQTYYGNCEKGRELQTEGGMSLRDYFAAKAMQALLLGPGQLGDECRASSKKCSEWAYEQADAMLAARKAGAQ
jgi:hypothetical protein